MRGIGLMQHKSRLVKGRSPNPAGLFARKTNRRVLRSAESKLFLPDEPAGQQLQRTICCAVLHLFWPDRRRTCVRMCSDSGFSVAAEQVVARDSRTSRRT